MSTARRPPCSPARPRRSRGRSCARCWSRSSARAATRSSRCWRGRDSGSQSGSTSARASRSCTSGTGCSSEPEPAERAATIGRRTRAVRAMNILFVIKNSANLRTLASVLRLLDERGHRIALACKDVKSRESHEQLQELVQGSARITTVDLPFARTPGWSDLASSLRRSADYLRYFDPVYRDADKLRAHADGEAPLTIRRVGRAAGSVPGGARALRRTLEGVERCLEPPERMIRFLEEQAPDVVLVTPLIGFGTPQADVVRAARRLGIPVCFPVRSWDNLTNK